MKLLKVSARNFKNLADNASIDLVAKARKSSEDKEYELQEIADGLYVYTTFALVGRNASGKTTALDLLDIAYSILSMFRIHTDYSVDGTELCLYFYHEGNIYKYETRLVQNAVEKTTIFTDEVIGVKTYYKSYVNEIYAEDFKSFKPEGILPEDVSSVFQVLKKREIGALKYDDKECGLGIYNDAFNLMEVFELDEDILNKVLRIFDDNISDLKREDSGNYMLKYNGEEKDLTPSELFNLLSSGTTKGIILYMLIVASLKKGFTILIDEIENHFHKTLVENIISLYKDKSVNKKNAMLVFTTHYCELLDLFNRQDNIYIAKSNRKVYLNSIHDEYDIRTDVLKSKQFYNNAFQTAVNYEALMDLKKALK